MQPIAAPSGDGRAMAREQDRMVRRSRTSGQHNQHLGRRGEVLAATYLRRTGLLVLDRNWRCDAGEIDIVAADGPVTVGCEVKTRSGQAYGSPQEGVDAQKLARLHQLVRRWAEQRGRDVDAVRVDVIGVLLRPDRSPRIEHMVGVS